MSEAVRDVRMRVHVEAGNMPALPDYTSSMRTIVEGFQSVSSLVQSTMTEIAATQQTLATIAQQAQTLTSVSATAQSTANAATQAINQQAQAMQQLAQINSQMQNSMSTSGGGSGGSGGGSGGASAQVKQTSQAVWDLYNALQAVKVGYVTAYDSALRFEQLREDTIVLYEHEKAYLESTGRTMNETLDQFIARKEQQFEATQAYVAQLDVETKALMQQGATYQEILALQEEALNARTEMGDLGGREKLEALSALRTKLREIIDAQSELGETVDAMESKLSRLKWDSLSQGAATAAKLGASLKMISEGDAGFSAIAKGLQQFAGGVVAINAISEGFGQISGRLESIKNIGDDASKKLKDNADMLTSAQKASLEKMVKQGESAEGLLGSLSLIQGAVMGIGAAWTVLTTVLSAVQEHQSKIFEMTEKQSQMELSVAQSYAKFLNDKAASKIAELDIQLRINEALAVGLSTEQKSYEVHLKRIGRESEISKEKTREESVSDLRKLSIEAAQEAIRVSEENSEWRAKRNFLDMEGGWGKVADWTLGSVGLMSESKEVRRKAAEEDAKIEAAALLSQEMSNAVGMIQEKLDKSKPGQTDFKAISEIIDSVKVSENRAKLEQWLGPLMKAETEQRKKAIEETEAVKNKESDRFGSMIASMEESRRKIEADIAREKSVIDRDAMDKRQGRLGIIERFDVASREGMVSKINEFYRENQDAFGSDQRKEIDRLIREGASADAMKKAIAPALQDNFSQDQEMKNLQSAKEATEFLQKERSEVLGKIADVLSSLKKENEEMKERLGKMETAVR